MMGERPDQRVSGIYEAALIIFLSLLGVALVAGASAALVDQPTTEDTTVQSLDGDFATQMGTEVASPQSGVLASDIIAEGEDVIITEDGIDLDDARLEEVEILTAQTGEPSPGDGREEMDIAIVMEESLAMQTHWGTYYPVSNTVEYAAENTNIMTKSTVDEVESQSWTAIGDLLGIGLEVSGVYDFDCDIYERIWPLSDKPWCGWHSDVTGSIGNDEIYHIDADTSLSFFDGFNIDRDNSHFDEHVLTEHSLNGQFQELPTEDRGLVTGLFGEGYWEYTDDPTVSDFLDETSGFEIAPALSDLRYIEFRSGADVWGFDEDIGENTWLRLQFDALLTDVNDMEPLDRDRVRYESTESVIELLDEVGYNDQISLVVNDNLGLGNDHGLGLTDDIEEVRDALRDLWMDPGQTNDFLYFDVAESFSTADAHLNEYGEHDDQAIVVITGGHEPMRPADAWYENIVDGIHDTVPSWITSLTGWDRLNEERPSPHEVGAQLDQEFIQMAEQTDAEVITLGLGPAHDGYRLAATADAASDGSPCLSGGPSSADCNYEAVKDVDNLEAVLSDVLFDEVSWVDVNRSQTALSVVSGDGDTIATVPDINDPFEFNADQTGPAGDYGTTMQEIGTTASFELEVGTGECYGYDSGPDGQGSDTSEVIELGGDTLPAYYYECTSIDGTTTDGDAVYFTHGDDVTDIDEAIDTTSWNAAPSDVLDTDHVSGGTLDLVDEEAGTEGVIVGVQPTDDEGYVLLHATVRTGLQTQFDVEIADDELADKNDWREVEHGRYGMLVGVPAGEELTLPVTITNNGIEGTEHLTVGYETEGPGQPIVYSEDIELDAGETMTEEFTWQTDMTDTDAHNTTLFVTSESDRDSLGDFTVFESGLNIDLNIRESKIDQPVNITQAVEEDESITIEVKITNYGADGAKDVPVGLAVGRNIENSTEIDDVRPVGEKDEEGNPLHVTTERFEWTPAYGILDDITVGVGDTVQDEVTLQAEMVHTDAQATITVEYVPVHADDEIDLEDPEAGEIDPIDVDIDEVEIEN